MNFLKETAIINRYPQLQQLLMAVVYCATAARLLHEAHMSFAAVLT
jgi:hypothetical protein